MNPKIQNIFTVAIPQNRVYGLDILRAIAILFVLFTHSRFFLPSSFLPVYDHFAIDGVSIFFVLSGYLIGGILIKTVEEKAINSKSLFQFWKNRWLRTVPPYLFVLCLLILINIKHLHPYIFKYFVFLQNINSPIPPFFGESWSLTVEEWFYLLIPPLIFIACKFIKQKYAILTVAIFVILVVTIHRYMLFVDLNKNDQRAFDGIFRKTVFLRIDAIMYGLIGAFMIHYYRSSWLRFKNLKLAIGLGFIIIYQVFLNTSNEVLSFYDGVVAIYLTSIGTLLMLPFFSQILIRTGVFCKTLTRISLISYSIYLLNWSIVYYTIRNRILIKIDLSSATENFIGLCLYWSLTIFFSVLLYKFIEIPFMRLRHIKSEKRTIA